MNESLPLAGIEIGQNRADEGQFSTARYFFQRREQLRSTGVQAAELFGHSVLPRSLKRQDPERAFVDLP
jgi:hypothetical protein